jgi:fructose-1,6-bisphosphatase I
MLDLVPEHIHDRSGIFMGSYNEVMKAKEILDKLDSK